MDVIKKIFSGNPVNNGYAMCGVEKNGTKYSHAPNHIYTVDIAILEIRLSGRLDDKDYYTA